MECIYLPCKKPAVDGIYCTRCLVARYCSERCNKLDIENHLSYCKGHLYSLREFSLVARVGSTNFGEVLTVQRKGMMFSQKVFVKRVLESFVPLKTFYREVAFHKSLDHQNIVKIVDFLEDKSKIYVITEDLEGETLASLIKKDLKVIEKDAWPIFTQLCIALDYLHRKNKAHGGLNPENILISNNVTKISELSWSPNTLLYGSDKLDYTAPEVLRSSIQNTKNDIWSLGVILYEMLHGVLPFKSSNSHELIRQITDRGFQINKFISKSATKLITDLLQEDPNLRPSISDVLKYQWIQQYADNQVKRNWQVKHKTFGEGTITDITGLIITVLFIDSEEEVLENDLIQEARVIDEYGNIVFDNFVEIVSKNDGGEGKCTPLLKSSYSKSEKVLKSAIRSGRSSRNDSRPISPMVKFDTNVKFEVNSRAPSRAGIDVSKGLPPKKPVKYDYEGITIPSESLSQQRRISTPRSRFLLNFKEKNRG